MGAGRVVRTTGRGARMARRMFKRKGGKNSPGKPASQQTIDVEATEVRPSNSLVPVLPSPNTSSTTPSTTSNTSEGVEDVLLRIQTNTISTEKLLKGSYAYKQKQQEENRKLLEKDKRDKKEDQIESREKKENKFKLPIPKQVKSFWEQLKSLFLAIFIGGFLGQIMKMRGPLSKIVRALAKVVDVIINIIGWIFNIVVTIIDAAYKLVDGMRGWVKNIFGEEGLAKFDSFLGWMNKVINATLIAAGIIAVIAGAIGAFSWGSLFAGGAAVATTATAATTTAATSTVGGLSPGATVGIVAGAGLLASGLGEGMGQLNKWGLEREKNWKQKAKDKWWTDPRKYFWAAAAGIMTILNRFFGVLGALFDVVGAPFRMIIELIRWPFLSEEDREKQRTNLAKYDARIREQFRKGLNAIDFLGLISDDKGSWGSLYGEKGTDEMGYTRDGKTESQQVPAKKGMILLGTPDLVATQDLLQGKPSGEKVHSILKITSEGKDITNESKKPKGLWRGITGVADFMTFGMFDFDQRNRKGAPKDFGIRRIAGGLADFATLGITDFDKRGAGVMQVDPMFGGKDKAWGSRNEQAKRREKQSGLGLKRAIGGFADFATFGMFDFDKQNRRGAPKGFGLKRIAGGLVDFVTAGATDFDKRGTGIGQMNLGEKMSKKRAYENNARVKNFRNREDELYDKFNQLPMETTVNPDGSITSRGSGNFIAGELFRPGQPLTERQYQVATMGMQMGNKYNDEVLRSYAMYEQQQGGNDVVIINRTSTVPIISEQSSDNGLYNNTAVIIDDGTSYASYQGH